VGVQGVGHDWGAAHVRIALRYHMGSDDILSVKGAVSPAGASGELTIGGKAPSALARLFPRRTAKAAATTLIAGQLLHKIKHGAALEEAELDYAAEVFDEAEVKFLRRREIQARAVAFAQREYPQLLAENQPRLLADSQPQPDESANQGQAPASQPAERIPSKLTADDWLSRFWEDAALVSDDMLQELYARLLVREASKPHSVSLRTIRALAYMDRRTAEQFARIAPFVVGDFVPGELTLLKQFGVTYSLILDLEDAGLADAAHSIARTYSDPDQYLVNGTTIVSWHHEKPVDLPIFKLRTAGEELARIADVPRRQEYMIAVASWIKRSHPKTAVAWATLPNPQWSGSGDLLAWNDVR
jgi:hypothetical protein